MILHPFEYYLFSTLIGEGDLRLSNGTTYYGRLEIYLNSTWSTISNKTVGASVPRVACRELGLPSTEAEFVRDKIIFTPADSEYVLVTRISCDGDEVRLTECYQFDWILVQFYTHKEDLAIVCKGGGAYYKYSLIFCFNPSKLTQSPPNDRKSP